MCIIGLEYRNNSALVFFFNEFFDFRRLKRFCKGLQIFSVFVTFTDSKNIRIGLRCQRIRVLGSKRVLRDVQTGFDRIVAVDDSDVNVLKGPGQLSSFDLNDLQVLWILDDVILGCGKADSFFQRDKTLRFEKQKRSGFIAGIVGNGYLSAVGVSASSDLVLPA